MQCQGRSHGPREDGARLDYWMLLEPHRATSVEGGMPKEQGLQPARQDHGTSMGEWATPEEGRTLEEEGAAGQGLFSALQGGTAGHQRASGRCRRRAECRRSRGQGLHSALQGMTA